MTREEFIKVLEEEGYFYKIEGDKIVVTFKGNVWLNSLKSLPLGVVFQNEGWVWLNSLKSLPPGVEFKNRGSVDLESLIGGWFNNWKGNIDGVDRKGLLNLMIKRGIFEI
jgi:hypothetical protein